MQSAIDQREDKRISRRKPGWISVIACYFFFLSAVARTFTEAGDSGEVDAVIVRMAVFIVMMSIVIWVTRLPVWIIHSLLVFQILLTISIQNLIPEFDYANILFVLISFQIALIFQGRTLAVWIVVLVPATCLSLMYSMGAMEGLSKSFSNMAGEISIFAYFIAVREIESARERQRSSMNELQQIHARLEEYAGQVEEVAAVEERNRLARELHDSVSQTLFSISLNIRTIQVLFQRDPGLVRNALEDLRALTETALTEIRSLITQMRPQPKK